MEHQKLVEALSSTYWAIQEDKLELIYDIVHNKEKYLLLAKEAKEAKGEVNIIEVAEPEEKPYVVSRGPVSVIQLHGVMMKRMNMFDAMSGGVSTEIFGRSLDSLIEDDKVKTIVLSIDSPGGSVLGTAELGNKIYAGSKKKKIVAVADSLAASAAYWVGSQASEFYATASAHVGSIGVLIEHVNARKRYEDAGYKIEFFRVPDGKAKPNPVDEIDGETREYIMDTLNKLYSEFVGAVARGRGVSEETVRDKFGKGRVVLAKDALAAGMVDGIVDIDSLILQSQEKIRMDEKEKAELESLKAKLAEKDSKIAELTGKVTTAEADAAQKQQELEQQKDAAALAKCREEVKGYKNLNLGEQEAMLLHTLDKSNPEQAAVLRNTFAQNNTRVGANLNPGGSQAGATAAAPTSTTHANAAEELDARAAKMVEAGTKKTLADAAAFILENDADLAARVAAGANPAIGAGESEEF